MTIGLTFSRGPDTVCLVLIRTAAEMCVLLKHQSDEHLRMATAPNLIEAVLHQQDQERDLVASGWRLCKQVVHRCATPLGLPRYAVPDDGS
jgi:hypothetical protein